MARINVKIDDSKPLEELSESEVIKIVRDIVAGQKELFDKLFVHYHGRVYGLAWSMTGNYEDAMDIVQECFFRAYRSLKSWKGRAKFSTWLHRITVNTAIDYMRRETKHRNKRVSPCSGEDYDREIQKIVEGVDNKTPLTELQRKELKRRIFAAVNQLSGMQKRCFILRYFGHLPVKEVAEAAGCGEGTAKRHLFRAREKLRGMLTY